MGFATGVGQIVSFMTDGPRGAGPSRIHPADRGANGASGPSPRSSIAALYEGEIFKRTRPTPPRHTIADAYGEQFPRERSIADFLHIAMERVAQSPIRELRLTVPELQEMTMLGISPSELEEISRAKIEARDQARKAEPITVQTMKAMAERISYNEIYDVYRHREEASGDRLLDVTDRALTLDQACAKLIGLAGFDQQEAKEHGLAQFDGGSISELCDRLQELTGDAYSFSNYETPLDSN